MANLANYSPEEVVVLIGGIVAISGITDGTFITLSKDAQPFSHKTSSDGVVTRVHKPSTLYKLTLTLHSASESNDLLTKLWLLDEATKRAKFPILIKDIYGTTMFYSLVAWIENIPDITYSTNITDRSWVIMCANAGMNVGSNEDSSGIVQDFFNAASSASSTVNRLLSLNT